MDRTLLGPDGKDGRYRFALLHPVERTVAQIAANARVLGARTLGVEVTIAALAVRCGLGNIDPQHDGGADRRAAIEACLEWQPLPPDHSWLVTIRPDLDALGGMALFALRRCGFLLAPALRARVADIARADAFANGPWPGPRPLPRDAAECIAALENRQIAALAAAAADHAVPLAARVRLLARWLRTGKAPARYEAAVEQRGRELAASLAAGGLRIQTAADGRIAIVEGSVEGAVRIGYLRAPVVAALNPAFRFRGGPPHRKYTICQYRRGYVDLAAVGRELATREPGWGGSDTIIGSPQGAGSALCLAQVVAVLSQFVHD